MKKKDIPVSGFDCCNQSKKAICDMINSIDDFCDIINSTILLGKKTEKQELSFVLYLIHNLRSELLKIKSYISGDCEKHSIMYSVYNLKAIESSGIFRGLYYKDCITNPMLIIKKSRIVFLLKRAYDLCIESIRNCRIISGMMTDYKSVVWNDNEVLIGALRNRQQLQIALKHNFYHIPVYMLPDDRVSISYVAIYQSKNFFGSDAGIRYYGRVLSCEKVARNEIREIPSDSTEDYYVLTIGGWHKLDNNIKADRGGSLLNFTNLYMLIRADTVDELYFSSEAEYRLYSSIKVSLRSNYNKVATDYENGIIAINDGYISVYKNDTLVYSVSVSDYKKNPVGHFKSIIKKCI